MLRKIRLLSLSLALLALVINLAIPVTNVDKELEPYYKAYSNYLSNNCYRFEYEDPHKLIIKFDNLEADVIGSCNIYMLDIKREIVIDRGYWNAVDDVSKMMLFGHEFAHCFLNSEHSTHENNFMFDNIPTDLNYFVFLFQFDSEVKGKCSKWKN